MKSGVMVNPENRAKINSLIKMWARDPSKFKTTVISQDDAVTELIRVFEEHNGPICDPDTPAAAKGAFKSVKLIGAEGI